MNTTVLEVHNLTTEFRTKAGPVIAVNDVSFKLLRGEILGLVGESGSGKSQTGYSILNLVDSPGRVVSGKVILRGQDLSGYSESQWRHIRGKRIAMIFQDPMLTLNPVLRVDTQMIETVQAHQKVSRSQARQAAREALVKVGIASPDERLEAYPHQFSGGMRQRVAIAIALLHEPEVIIADEPTTALDVTIQEQILAEMQGLCRNSGTAMVWITHDLSVIAGLADSVAVMYAGRIVEYGQVQDVISRPEHPYTVGLINSAPSRNERGVPIHQIPGNTPHLAQLPPGCPFNLRCSKAKQECFRMPPLSPRESGRQLRCFFPYEYRKKEAT
ncbi:ABC transporter ATP-binding protein [Polaromonas sp. YR568]|uniref:ABC transporter ATP-binding protein n=1 Tax=Polaromonas sp. YR568 TaxID=1855301 RepID=UPI00398BE27A